MTKKRPSGQTTDAREWKTINRDMQVRPGKIAGYFEIQMSGKKFVMREVDHFFSESTASRTKASDL